MNLKNIKNNNFKDFERLTSEELNIFSPEKILHIFKKLIICNESKIVDNLLLKIKDKEKYNEILEIAIIYSNEETINSITKYINPLKEYVKNVYKYKKSLPENKEIKNFWLKAIKSKNYSIKEINKVLIELSEVNDSINKVEIKDLIEIFKDNNNGKIYENLSPQLIQLFLLEEIKNDNYETIKEGFELIDKNSQKTLKITLLKKSCQLDLINCMNFLYDLGLNLNTIENDIDGYFLFKKGENKVTRFLFSKEDLKEKLNLGMWNHFPLRAIFEEENINLLKFFLDDKTNNKEMVLADLSEESFKRILMHKNPQRQEMMEYLLFESKLHITENMKNIAKESDYFNLFQMVYLDQNLPIKKSKTKGNKI